MKAIHAPRIYHPARLLRYRVFYFNDMKDENYIQISGWMINQMKLSGTRLIAYACIYGFSQDGQSCFGGSYDYIAKCIGKTRSTAIRVVASLVDDGLVEKIQQGENGNIKSKYIAVQEMIPVAKCDRSSSKVTPVTSSKMLPNIDNNNNTNIDKEQLEIFEKPFYDKKDRKTIRDQVFTECGNMGVTFSEDLAKEVMDHLWSKDYVVSSNPSWVKQYLKGKKMQQDVFAGLDVQKKFALDFSRIDEKAKLHAAKNYADVDSLWFAWVVIRECNGYEDSAIQIMERLMLNDQEKIHWLRNRPSEYVEGQIERVEVSASESLKREIAKQKYQRSK